MSWNSIDGWNNFTKFYAFWYFKQVKTKSSISNAFISIKCNYVKIFSLFPFCFCLKYRLMCCFVSWSSPSILVHLTSQLRPLTWQPNSYWQRKHLFLISLASSCYYISEVFDFVKRNNPLIAMFVCVFILSISEQPDLTPVTAFAKVVIELPLSVSGWVKNNFSINV